MSINLHALADRIGDFLVRMDLDTERTEEGIFFFKHGSTVVMLSIFQQDNHRWVRFVATMLAEVTPSMELLARLLRLNTEVLLGAFLLFEDGTLAFSHTLLGDHLDFEEFEYALTYVAQVGDDYDEELQVIAGGLRAEDILRGD
jgi:hypothetical protein